GPAGLQKFQKDLERFVTTTTTTKFNGKAAPKLVLVSPVAHEDVGRPGVPDGKANNKNLKLYTDAMAKGAARHPGAVFIDLFAPTLKGMAADKRKWTFNGIHLTDYGYSKLAPILDEALFGPRAAGAAKVDLAKLRQTVLEKNRLFFY